MINKNEVIKILKEHGFTVWQNTATKNGEWVSGTSFVDAFGICDSYPRKNVFAWLGY